MKKCLFAFIVLLSVTNVQSQINLEHVYQQRVFPVHFAGAGYKYYHYISTTPWSGTINIYNLNHSLYQSINTPASIPHTMPHNSSIIISSLSDSLFNTNTSNIEYILYWVDSISYQYHTRIYDDAGNMLFSKDSVNCWPTFTPAGYKLVCYGTSTSNLNYNPVYSLPGAVPCDECIDNILTRIEPNQTKNDYHLNSYPNPSNNSTTIDYKLPDGINQGQIIFLNLQGIEIKRFTVDNTFTTLIISTADISAGVYLYQLQVNNNIISSNKMIVIK